MEFCDGRLRAAWHRYLYKTNRCLAEHNCISHKWFDASKLFFCDWLFSMDVKEFLSYLVYVLICMAGT